MGTINTRITELVEGQGLNNSSFAKSLNVFPSIIGNITTGRMSKPSFELLEKIAGTYPQVSMEWLVRGDGPMIKPADALDPECWDILEREQQRARQLQTDYDNLMQKYQASKQQKPGV